MSTVYLCRGIPASGKSTLTRQMTAASDGRLKRICKDELRLMMDTTHRFGLAHMREYNDMIDGMIHELLNSGFDVVLDETFMRVVDLQRVAKMLKAYRKNFKEDVRMVILDLTQVPFEECVLRDKARHPSLGYDVLLDYKETLEREGDTCTITESLRADFGHFISATITSSERPFASASA